MLLPGQSESVGGSLVSGTELMLKEESYESSPSSATSGVCSSASFGDDLDFLNSSQTNGPASAGSSSSVGYSTSSSVTSIGSSITYDNSMNAMIGQQHPPQASNQYLSHSYHHHSQQQTQSLPHIFQSQHQMSHQMNNFDYNEVSENASLYDNFHPDQQYYCPPQDQRQSYNHFDDSSLLMNTGSVDQSFHPDSQVNQMRQQHYCNPDVNRQPQNHQQALYCNPNVNPSRQVQQQQQLPQKQQQQYCNSNVNVNLNINSVSSNVNQTRQQQQYCNSNQGTLLVQLLNHPIAHSKVSETKTTSGGNKSPSSHPSSHPSSNLPSNNVVSKRQKKVGKKRKDPNEPQKPVSAYALFFRDTQALIKGGNPNASFGEVSKIVASMWDQLDQDSKTAYKRRTEHAKKEYLKALAAYRASLLSSMSSTSSSNNNNSCNKPVIEGEAARFSWRHE